MNSAFFWDHGIRAALAISRPFKEALPPVANKEDVDVHERLATLETKTELAQRISKLEAASDGGVTWPKLLLAIGAFVTMLAVLTTLYHNVWLPNQVEAVIGKSSYLNNKFLGIDNQFKALGDKLDKQLSTSPMLNPKIIGAVLKDATSADVVSLTASLSKVRNTLTIAKEQKVPISGHDYLEISRPLFLRYDKAKPTLQRELWLTFVDLANTKVITDGVLHPIPDAEVVRAKNANNFFENRDVDLSSRTAWKDSIFKNCKITISAPEKNLTLTNVRFVEGEFNFAQENSTAVKLFQAVLEQGEQPKITATIVKYTVDPPIYKGGDAKK
jgi:hypothetical protein